MNTFDFVIAAIVLFGLWRGFSKGFVKTFINLIGWLVALIAASRLANNFAELFAGVVASPKLQVAMGFLLVVLVVLTLLTIVSSIVNKVMETLKLKIIDRFAGGVLGAFKGVLVVLIFMSVSSPLLQRLPFWQNSTLAPELMPYAPVAMQLSKDVFQRSVQELTNPNGEKSNTNANEATETVEITDGPTSAIDVEMTQANDAAFEN